MERNLSVKEVRGYLNVSLITVQRWIARGEFPGAFKLGVGKTSHWRIPLSDVEKFKDRYKKTEERSQD